jgi:translation initiation factor 2 alpha subunit (eIF-2alpha)
MIKPSMLYAKHFLLLNSPKFQTTNQPKKHGKSWKQHMKARNLLNLPKLQMLISRFEEIKMLEEETFGEFYSKMSDLRNSMVSLGKPILDVKLIRKILRSLAERFRIKVTTIEESKDLE